MPSDKATVEEVAREVRDALRALRYPLFEDFEHDRVLSEGLANFVLRFAARRERKVLERAADRIGIGFPFGKVERDEVRDWLRRLAAEVEVHE